MLLPPLRRAFTFQLYHRKAVLHKGKFQIRMGTAQFLGVPSDRCGVQYAEKASPPGELARVSETEEGCTGRE